MRSISKRSVVLTPSGFENFASYGHRPVSKNKRSFVWTPSTFGKLRKWMSRRIALDHQFDVEP